MPRIPAAAAIALLLLTACGGGRGAGADAGRDVIGVEEIRAAHFEDVYSLVQALRPNWLIPRGGGSITQREEIQVYLDGMRAGTIDYLRQVSTRSISSIRFLDGLEATQRWGLDHGQGAIVISTR